MGSGEGFTALPEDLRAHAARVEDVADGIGTAEQAGRAVRVDTGAYGQLCAMVPVFIGALDDLVLDGISTAQTSVRDTAARLRATAATYQAADETNQAAIDQLSGQT
jgi:hypothetical protein